MILNEYPILFSITVYWNLFPKRLLTDESSFLTQDDRTRVDGILGSHKADPRMAVDIKDIFA